MNNSNDEDLNIRCTICKVRPSDLNLSCDTIICDECINLNLIEKNPYLGHGKFSFRVDNVEDSDRFRYLREVYIFVNSREKK